MTALKSNAYTQGILPYTGLTAEQVKRNRQDYGSNILTPPKRDPWWKLYLEKFADPVIRILMMAAVIAITVGWMDGEYVEGLGIIIAILLATTLAFLNEYQASQEFDALNQVYDQVSVKVIRDGQFTKILRQDVVVGDIVYLEQGEEVPADGIVLDAVSLYIDQSKITGESAAVKKRSYKSGDKENDHHTYPVDRLYRSTIVTQGEGILKVTAVGDHSEIGQLATAVATIENAEATPLNLQLEKLSQLIGIVGLTVSSLTFMALLIQGFLTGELSLTVQQSYLVLLLIFGVTISLMPIWLPVVNDGLKLINQEINIPRLFCGSSLKIWVLSGLIGVSLVIIGLIIGYPLGLNPNLGQDWLPFSVVNTLLKYFMVAVTIIVVAVPEGLAMSVTLSLAYSVRKMAATNNLVRRMHACETIGAATVICSDKTGTLTLNQMQVKEAYFPCLESLHPHDRKRYRYLLAEAIAANSTADLEKKPQQSAHPLGNVTEGALLLWLDQQNIDYLSYRHQFKIKLRMIFSPEKKYMGTFGHSSVFEQDILHLKGAPEVILSRCSHILTHEGIHVLTEVDTIRKKIQFYEQRGMRVLAFAYHPMLTEVNTEEIEKIDHNLILLGFVAIADPLRAEVPEAICTCLNAGIEVKVVTGDSPQTAQEIARQIGLWHEDQDSLFPDRHLTGQQFKQLSEQEAKTVVKSLKILSRACPLDKLRLIQLLQANGEVVAVTGDGTNDAAALKQAQVGLSMGSGTAIAKEASDIILLDDSFKSIVNAIVWGRSLYENIQRFILFQLTINVVALGIALLGPFIGVALPLTVTQMLWVNLIMDTFAALALATEPPHWSVMEHLPRNPETFIVSGVMGQNIIIKSLGFLLFLVAFLLYLGQDEIVNNYELSIFFAVFVFLQFWNLFNARCLGLTNFALHGLNKNPAFMLIAFTIFMGQILIIQLGGNIFRTVPLSWQHWLVIISVTSLVLWLEELWRLKQRLYRFAEVKSQKSKVLK
jgi:Ca2+-transporting ATPase